MALLLTVVDSRRQSRLPMAGWQTKGAAARAPFPMPWGVRAANRMRRLPAALRTKCTKRTDPQSPARVLCTRRLDRAALLRSVYLAAFAGTVLMVVNQGQDLLARDVSPRWVIAALLTYFVLFVLAAYVQVRSKR